MGPCSDKLLGSCSHSSCNRLYLFNMLFSHLYFVYLCFCSPYSHQTLISVIMLIPDASSFSSLVDFFSFAAWLFYGGTFASLLWLRYKKPNLNRPYKVSCLSKCTKNTMQLVNAPQVIRENWSVCLRQNSD